MATLQGDIISAADLGHAVAKIRAEHGLSQRDMALKLGVSQRYLGEIELGLPKIFNEQFLKVLGLVGIRLSYTAELPS